MQKQIMKKRNNKQTRLPKQERPADLGISSDTVIPLEEVQKRAYAIFQTRGGAPGHELDDWLLAEVELRTEIALVSGNRAQLSQGRSHRTYCPDQRHSTVAAQIEQRMQSDPNDAHHYH
jgi:hypothetical protein